MIDYLEVGRRITERRKQLNLTLADVALEVGVAASTIQRYEAGKFTKMKMPVIESIASVLNVNPAWLIGKTDDPVDHTDSNVKVAYKLACAIGEDIKNNPDIIPYTQGRRLPIIGTIAAGSPLLAIENIVGYDYADVPESLDYFFLRVRGDSMINAHIYDGDLVLIQKQNTADNGQIVVCLVNGDEATLKRFYQRGETVLLQPENPAYQPIIVSVNEFDNGYAHILGIAKEVKHRL